MAHVTIEERGCRGCTLCVDLCPVQVFRNEEDKAKVVREENCIGCLSCYYVCPSQAIKVTDVEMLRPFHRIEEHAALCEKFVGTGTSTASLTSADCGEALKDVAARLHALAGSVVEVFGAGYQSIGRRAGARAAVHLPEIMGENTLEDVLNRMKKDFEHAFTFDFQIQGTRIDMHFHPCVLCKVVEERGEKVGDAVLCKLFHDYWAGLIGTFVKSNFSHKLDKAGEECLLQLNLRG